MNSIDTVQRYAICALVVLVIGGLWGGWMHRRGEVVGAARVQAAFDAYKAEQTAAALAATSAARGAESAQRGAFDVIAANYEATIHAQTFPLADSLAAGIADGSLRLRNDATCPAAPAGDLSAATARSRAADAAATQALADRAAAAIAAVRAGDAADARERQLGAQVTALQAILRAERTGRAGQ